MVVQTQISSISKSPKIISLKQLYSWSQTYQNKTSKQRLKTHLQNSINLESLSLIVIRYILKEKMKYKYKRLSEFNSKNLSSEKIRLFWEINYIQLFLAFNHYKLVWVDKFRSISEHIKSYNWTKWGFKTILLKLLWSSSNFFWYPLMKKRHSWFKSKSITQYSNSFISFYDIPKQIWLIKDLDLKE